MKRIILMTALCLSMMSAYAWKPLFVGHRGSDIGVENTKEAYLNGINVYEVDGLECDLQTTKDGQIVLCHDSKLDNYGNKGVVIHDHTLAELQALTLKQTRTYIPTGKDSTYTGKICTFEEYLKICSDNHVFPVIELKGNAGFTTSDMSSFKKAYDLVCQYELQDTAVFICFTQGVIEYIRTNYPALKCQKLWMSTEITDDIIDWHVKWGVNPSIDISATYWDIHTVKRCHDRGLEVATWTINDLGTYKSYVTGRGCYMSTGDCVKKSQAPEGTDIDWDNVTPYKNKVKLNVADWALPETPLDSLRSDSIYFFIDKHQLFLHRGDTKGQGSWKINDLYAENKPIAAQVTGWTTDAKDNTYFTYQRIDESTIYLYEKCNDSVRAWYVGTGEAPFKATSLELEQNEISMLVGDTVYIQAIVEPANCTSTMTWTLSATRQFSKKSLDNYRVMLVAKSLGDATLTAKIDGLKQECQIHVVQTLATDDVEANQNNHRKILKNGQLYILKDGVLYDASGRQLKNEVKP